MEFSIMHTYTVKCKEGVAKEYRNKHWIMACERWLFYEGRAVHKDNLCILGTMVKELVGATGPQFARIILICLGECFRVELGSAARDCKDIVSFEVGLTSLRSEGHKKRKYKPI